MSMTTITPAVHGWENLGWRAQAACRDGDTELFFPAGTTGGAVEQIDKAKIICHACSVQAECLEFSLVFHQEFGIWGGTTEDERRVIRRQWRAKRRREQQSAAAAVG